MSVSTSCLALVRIGSVPTVLFASTNSSIRRPEYACCRRLRHNHQQRQHAQGHVGNQGHW